MKRNVLMIPLDEIKRHLAANTRKDIKVVAPEILTDKLFQILTARGKPVKAERPVDGDMWKHSGPDNPNLLCESGDFADISLPQYALGPFAVSFANESAFQDAHHHERHLEIYYSEHSIAAEFKTMEDAEFTQRTLPEGGVFIFGPRVIHKMTLTGLTLVIEAPSVANDRF
jgi:hypothetical protein